LLLACELFCFDLVHNYGDSRLKQGTNRAEFA